MASRLTQAQLAAFSQALVVEIKSAMGRNDLSARGLAVALGENHQYITSRLGAGNPRTGKRVELHVRDLAAISAVLDLDPVALVEQAVRVAGLPSGLTHPEEQPVPEPTPLPETRERSYPAPVQTAARTPHRSPTPAWPGDDLDPTPPSDEPA